MKDVAAPDRRNLAEICVQDCYEDKEITREKSTYNDRPETSDVGSSRVIS